MRKLLNIDGGGVRAYLPLLMLKEIEKRTQKSIIDIFDFYSGVSASSIVFAGLLTGYTVDQMITLFKQKCQEIFYRSYYQIIKSGCGVLSSKYNGEQIEKVLYEFYGDVLMQDTTKPLTILTYDLKQNMPMYIHSYKDCHQLQLWKAVRGSTSAPTYFPPYELNGHTLIDGGVVTNNLSEMTFLNALCYYGPQEDYYQLSIGTGYTNIHASKSTGLLGWSSSIFDILFQANSQYDMKMLHKIGKYENLKQFHRLDIKLEKDIQLDDITSFDKMDWIFCNWLSENNDLMNIICQELINN